MTKDAGKPPAAKDAREKKLAAALRANLRRRKMKRDEGRGARDEKTPRPARP